MIITCKSSVIRANEPFIYLRVNCSKDVFADKLYGIETNGSEPMMHYVTSRYMVKYNAQHNVKISNICIISK